MLAKATIKDKMQGFALLAAKKIICGDEWDALRLSEETSLKWRSFCVKLGIVQQNASRLLDFAGYKDRGGEIETASHYREVKKLVGPDQDEIDRTYKAHGGSKLKTAMFSLI